jgi:Cys-rich repeat protein
MEDRTMKRFTSTMLALPMLLGLWMVLSGADQGCYLVGEDCVGLDEAACLERTDCRAIYSEVLYDGSQNGLRCGPEYGVRCVGPDPVFEGCEEKPTCAGMDEGSCLSEPSCQAVYGYSDEYYMLGGLAPRCGATRCLEPPEVFIDCVEAGVDFCAGLDEPECLRRPACEAEYDYPGCEGDTCWDGTPTYRDCHLRGGTECVVDEDCYSNYPMDDLMPPCENWRLACEAGVCVEHCDEPVGCQSDAECAAGERCEIRCGNGWCEGVCVPAETTCTSNEECPAGFECIFDACPDCPPDALCAPCAGTCQPASTECWSDADCAAGEMCQIDSWCEDGTWCGPGVCVPVNQDCQFTGCPAGEVCEVTCYDCAPGTDCEGGCVGTCVPENQGCQADSDCPSGYVCQFMPCDCLDTDPNCFEKCRELGGICVPNTNDCQVTGCPEGYECQVACPDCGPEVDCEGQCFGTCQPVTPTCFGDQDCPEGFYCAGDFCDPTVCGGVCLPRQEGCGSDAECAPGERCDVYCGNGWCQGSCVAVQDITWVQFEPMQCVETPWEADRAANPELYAGCMLDCGPAGDCWGFDELCVLGTYLANLGIVAQDLRHVSYGVDVCEACGVCARGDVFYALVGSQDVELLLGLGFQLYGIL